jgi:hypothetical protein
VTRTISLVDKTSQYRPPPGALSAMAEALTIQVERDFAPAWGVMPVRYTVGRRGRERTGADKIYFFDSQAEVLQYYGWHEVNGEGLPYAHVLVESAIKSESDSDWLTGPDAVSATASHEALEMLADPAANGYAFDGHRLLWALEVCDPVQAGTYVIVAGTTRVTVSNFVLPAYFNPWAKKPFDHLGALKAAYTLDTRGYAVREKAGGEDDIEGKRFRVVFDHDVPAWQQQQKLHGYGRTWWRNTLTP